MTATDESKDELRRKIGPGSILQLDGQTVRVVSLGRDDEGALQVVLDEGDRLRKLPFMELASSLLEASQNQDVPEEGQQNPLLADLPLEEQARIKQRFADLLQVQTGSQRGDPDGDRREGRLDPRYDPMATSVTQRVEVKVAELKVRGETGASRSTLFRQLKNLDQGVEGLIHGNRELLPDPLSNVDPQIVEILSDRLKDEPKMARLSDAKLMVKCRAALDRHGIGKEISSYKLSRVVGELTRSDRLHLEAKARERQSLKPDVTYGRRLVSRPGELVQIDATDTTIHVFDPISGWVSATILTAIDIFTRCIVAMRVLTGKPTSRDVAMLMWDMSRPTITRAGFPYELAYYHGIPRLVSINRADEEERDHAVIGTKPTVTPSAIVMDHGRENDSLHVLAAAARAGIDVVFCPPRAAHAKGVIESVHNMLREVQSLFAAFKGASPGNHPAGVEDRAMLTASDLHDALWEYVLTIYHHSPHTGLTDLHRSSRPLTPAGVYATYLESGGWIDVPSDPMRAMNFLSTSKCLLQDYGVNVQSRTYNSPALRQLRGVLQQGVGAKAERITVYYDRWDVSRVYVRHPRTGEWMRIPRTGEAAGASMPCSELWDRALNMNVFNRGRDPLTAGQIQSLAANLHNRWSEEAMTDKRLARMAAIENGRASAYAHDLVDQSPEFRKLAFGDDDLDAVGSVETSAQSDDPFDEAQEEDEDFFDLEAIEGDGLAL